MGKVITVLGIIALIGGAIYLWQGDTGSFQVSFLNTATHKNSQTVDTSTTSIGTVSSSTQEEVSYIGSQAIQWVSDTAQSFLDSVVQTAKDDIQSKVQETAQNAYQSVGEKIGILDASQNDFLIRYITSPGAPTSFNIQNTLGDTATGTLNYRIVWGDGNIESQQTVPVQKSYIFLHTWSQVGEYDIDFYFTHSGRESVLSTHVQVRE